MFKKASAVITGGNFNSFTNCNELPNVMELLKQKIASAALHNAAARYDPPQCHPDTRVAIRKKIMDWAQDPAGKSSFMWLSGPAGSGKSAIGHTIAKTSKIPAATFFFSGVAAEHHESAFVPTLVYQIAHRMPAFRKKVAQVLENNPVIFDLSLDTQIEHLLVQPLDKMYAEMDHEMQPEIGPLLFIFDGFEECGDFKLQARILKALCRTAKDRHLPLRFLVISRSTPKLRLIFTKGEKEESISSQTEIIFLDESHDPDTDIRTFLNSKFDDTICILSLDPTEQNRSSESDIEMIVQKSSGQFVYPSSIIRYLESASYNTMDNLHICLGRASPTSNKDKPFSDLDSMFLKIFTSIPVDIRDILLEMLAILLVPNIALTESQLMEFMHADKDNAINILHDLHSLVYIPSLNNSHGQHIRFFHSSLCDFLRDQCRSKEFFIKAPSRSYSSIIRRSLESLASPNITPDGTFAARSIFRGCLYNALPSYGLHNDLCDLDLKAHLQWLSSPMRSQGLDSLMLDASVLLWDAVPLHTPFRILDVEVQKLTVFLRQNNLFSHHQLAFDDWLHAELAYYPERWRKNELIAIFKFGESTCQKFLEGLYTILTDDLIIYQFVDNFYAEESVVYMNSLPHPSSLDSEYITVLRQFFSDKKRSKEYCFNDKKFLGLAIRMLDYIFETDQQNGDTARKKTIKMAAKLLPKILQKASTNPDFLSSISKYRSQLMPSPSSFFGIRTVLSPYLSLESSSQDDILLSNHGDQDTFNQGYRGTFTPSLESQLSEMNMFDASDVEQSGP